MIELGPQLCAADPGRTRPGGQLSTVGAIVDHDIAGLAQRIPIDSLLLTPASRAPLDTDNDIRAFARRYLLTLI